MKTVFLFIHLIIIGACYAEEITPYKFIDSLPYYEIPASSRFTVNRSEAGSPNVISYHSSDAFVEKAKSLGVNVTYLRIEDMDHYVRKRPDIINQSFEWLKNQI